MQEKKYPKQLKEGWGITNDDKLLYVSDGSSQIFKIDPITFAIVGKIDVQTAKGTPIYKLNELEYVKKGEKEWIWANIYG